MKLTCLGAALVLALAPSLAAAAGPGVDLHAFWDDRCASCHGDAGDFARRTLRVENGQLKGTHHREDLSLFLRRHYLAEELVTPVTAMLTAQAEAEPMYREHCAGCHGRAADFARKSLARRGEVLVGKAGGKPVAEFLLRHGGLQGAEVPMMVRTLERVLGEVSGGNP